MAQKLAVRPGTRVALVTGASSGIGKACALALLEDGWTVIFAARRAALLQEIIESAATATAVALPCDVSDEASVRDLFTEIRGRFGRLDLLFNNAGVAARSATPDELGVDEWRRTIDINLNGMFYCLAQAFRIMREQNPKGGRIINNGSTSAHAPRPNSIAYTTSKHAITGMTKAASLDGRPFGIAVGQINIGNVTSDLSSYLSQGALQADGSVRPEPMMDMEAVVDTFMAMANLPPSANVLFTTVMATNMPLVGRG